IYYNTYCDNRVGLGNPTPGIVIFGGCGQPRATRPEDYALGRRYLEELADYTGGWVFAPASTQGGLAAAFVGIAEKLRRQYQLGYTPSDDGKPGQRKTIKVGVNRPNLVIRARESYIVGDPSASGPTS